MLLYVNRPTLNMIIILYYIILYFPASSNSALISSVPGLFPSFIFFSASSTSLNNKLSLKMLVGGEI